MELMEPVTQTLAHKRVMGRWRVSTAVMEVKSHVVAMETLSELCPLQQTSSRHYVTVSNFSECSFLQECMSHTCCLKLIYCLCRLQNLTTYQYGTVHHDLRDGELIQLRTGIKCPRSIIIPLVLEWDTPLAFRWAFYRTTKASTRMGVYACTALGEL